MTNHLDLKRGAVFKSDNEVEKFINKYCDKYRILFIKSRSLKLASTNVKYKSEIDKNCTYYSIIYNCKFGIQRCSTSLQRQSSTFKRNCKAFIKFQISQKTKSYIISEFNITHSNHDGFEKFYQHLTEIRRLKAEEKIDASKLLSLGCKPARLQLQIRKDKKKEIRRKDLLNLVAATKCKEEDEISRVIELLRTNYGANVQVLHEDQVCVALYFSTESMRLNVKKYGQIIFVDCTYKIFKAKYSLMLFVLEDGEGRSQVVAVGILVNESKPLLKWVIENFKRDNEVAITVIKGFMTDKDMTERDVIKEVFPHANLFICQFHVLRSFSREICTRKMNITIEQRECSLRYIDRMVKSTSENMYYTIYEEFGKNCPKVVKDYFNTNWHSCSGEWTKYSIFESNYGNLTNNRIESMNSKLKNYLKKYNSLTSFITDFFDWDKHRNIEMSYKDIQNILKIKITQLTTNIDVYKEKYKVLLTQYAFEKLLKQLNLCKYVSFREMCNSFEYTVYQNDEKLRLSPSSCTCFDRWSMQLPCRHIFAVRRILEIDLFSKDLCDVRWYKVQDILSKTAEQATNKNTSFTIHKVTSSKKQTIGNKRKKLKIVCDELISLASEQTDEKFQNRLSLLCQLRDMWKANKKVNLITSGTNTNTPIKYDDNTGYNLNKSSNLLNISGGHSSSDTEADLTTDLQGILCQPSEKIIGKVSCALATRINMRRTISNKKKKQMRSRKSVRLN